MSVLYLWDPDQNQEFPAATTASVRSMKATLRVEKTGIAELT